MPILFNGLFNSGSDFSTYNTLQVDFQNYIPSQYPLGIAGKLDIVDDPVGKNGRVSMHTLNRIDSTRCEVTLPYDAIGSDRWYYCRIFLDPNWIKDYIGVSEIIMQVHDQPDAGDPNREPPFSIRVYQDKVQVIRSSEGPLNTAVVSIEYEAPIVVGKWIEWVVHSLWKGDLSGSLQVWKDGRPVVSRTGIATCFADALPVYAKMGPYKYFHNRSPLQQRKAWYSGMAIGTGYSLFNDFCSAIGLSSFERERVAAPNCRVIF